MFNLDDLRAQVQTHNYIAMRDLPKRFVCVQIALGAQWYAGWPWVALANFVWIVLIELVIYWLIRTTPEVTRISGRHIAALAISSHVACIGYFGAGLLMTLHSDLGIFMGGLCWILAAVMTTLMMFSSTLLFYTGAALAGFPITMLAMLLAFNSDLEGEVGLTWLLPTSAVLLFIINTVQSLWELRDTHRVLRETRAELLQNLRKVEHMSRHDGLTGLPNRGAFTEDLAEAIAGSRKQGVSVLMIDLDGFKPINDSFGHEAGDAILVSVAALLTATLDGRHRAYRLGGDEFAVICRGIRPHAATNIAAALATAIRHPVTYREKTLTVGASIGVASAADADMAPETLCAQADQAMYLAKSGEDQAPVHFEADMALPTISQARRAELEGVVRKRGIVPGYQARFTVDGTRLAGLEALARWPHPDQGLRRAETFLPEILEAGLMSDLTHLILRQVLEHIALWRAAGADPGRVSVNMDPSVLSTQSGREDLEWVLGQYPESIPFLAFEVTEEIYTGRSGAIAAETLRHLRARGIEIYLDDFGTGFGAYPHLRDLTPDQLKIDGSLVARLGTGGDAEQVIGGFITLAHGLGAQVVAEGVETEAQRVILECLGCDYIEGWHLAEELAPEQVLAFLIQGRAETAEAFAPPRRRAFRGG